MYDVLIKDTQSGEAVVYHDPTDWNGDFIWEDGNYACDCNRSLFFQWATLGTDAEVEESRCGDGRFVVEITVDGAVVYTELQDNVDDK